MTPDTTATRTTPSVADVTIVDQQLLVVSFCNHQPGCIQSRNHFRFLIRAINLCLAHVSNGKESDMGFWTDDWGSLKRSLLAEAMCLHTNMLSV